MQFYALLCESVGLCKMLRSVVDCRIRQILGSHCSSLWQADANRRVVQVSQTDSLFQHRSLQLLAHPASMKPNVDYMFRLCFHNILVISFRPVLLYQHPPGRSLRNVQRSQNFVCR